MADQTPPPAPSEEASPSRDGVPVVDLSRVLHDLYQQAEQERTAAYALERLALARRRHADYLESLAQTLDGSVAAGVSPPALGEG